MYQIEKDKVEFEKAKNMSNNNIVKREFNLMGLVGFKKKPYEGLPFTICPGNVFNARIMSTLNMGDDNENKQGMTKKQIRLMEKKKKI